MPTLWTIALLGASFFAADLTPLSAFRETGEPDIPFVKDGEALLPIVTDASPRNVAAARELASVVNSATGVRPAIIREAEGQRALVERALYIGNVAAARESGLAAPVGNPEAFRVVAKGGSIFFLGRSDYAVYDWCERQLDARCFWFDKAGDELSVPKRASISAKSVDYSDSPVYSKRICGSCSSQRWAKYAKSGSSHRGGVRVHAPHGWHKDVALVREHPEIFALTRDGRRAATPLLCYGNPATLEYYERRIDEAIAGLRDSGGIVDTGRKVITVSPWDVPYDCRCEYCAPFYDASLGERGYASPVVWGRFLKGLARWAKANHPDYLISFLPYWTMCEVPPGLDLREEGNCEPEVCVMPGIACMKSDSVKADEERIIRDWTRVTGRKALLWHYTCWPAEDTPAAYLFGETAQRHFADVRDCVDGVFICGGGEVPRLSLMYYVMMRAMWNPEVDVQAIFDSFAERMFGPAAKPMRRLIALQERGWARRWPNDRLLDGNIYGYSYPPWVVREMKQCLAAAERRAASDPLALRRVRRYASVFPAFFEEAALVGEGFPRHPLAFAHTKSPLVVDGVPDESVWLKAKPRNFVLVGVSGLDTPAKNTTAVRAAYSKEGVCLAFECDEPHVENMVLDGAQIYGPEQDSLGVVFETCGVCWHMQLDASGRVGVFANGVPVAADGVEAAAHIGADGWSAEISIPFSAIGENAAHDFIAGGWRGNLVRWRPGAKGEHGEWSRLSTRRSHGNKDRNAFVPFVSAP